MKNTNKRKRRISKVIGYWVNEHISKGVKQQFLLLLAFIIFVIIVFGVLAAFVNAVTNVNEGFWQSFIHLLDPGTVSGNDFSNMPLLVLMVIVTLIGMVFTGLLISIINNGLEQKLSDLRSGSTPIVEKNHMILFGCNSSTYTILAEQIESNLNNGENRQKHSNAVIVVADSREKEEMERDIVAHISNFHNTKIICRGGELTQDPFLESLAIDEANSVVICCEDDETTLKQILAVSNYLRSVSCSRPKIVAQFHNQSVLISAQTALEGFEHKLLYCEDVLSRITAQVCRQPGLSYVLQDLFNYQGNEIYIESTDASGKEFNFDGQFFADIINQIDKGTVIGVKRQNKEHNSYNIILDPEQEFQMRRGDELILIAEDDGVSELVEPFCFDYNSLMNTNYSQVSSEKMKIIVLGWNQKLPAILKYLDEFVAPGSTAELYSSNNLTLDSSVASSLHRLTIHMKQGASLEDPGFLSSLIKQDVTNFLLLCEDSDGQNDADTKTIMRLLHLRNLIEKEETTSGKKDKIIITSELKNPDNQRLMKIARVNDFIVGSEFTNRVLTQIANCPELEDVFREMLTEKGAEIYLRPAEYYLDLSKNKPVSYAALSSICYVHRDIALGWMSFDEEGSLQRTLNPPKATEHTFLPGEEIIVLSQGKKL